MKVSSTLLIVSGLALAGCDLLQLSSGGGGSGGGTSGVVSSGGSSGSTPPTVASSTTSGGGTTAGAGFTGTASLKGVVIQNDKVVQSALPVPGAPAIHETATYAYLHTGANQSTTATTAVVDLQNVTLTSIAGGLPVSATGTGSLNVSGKPGVANGSGTSGFGIAQFGAAPGSASTAGDSFSLITDDLDNDGDDDFFIVELGVGTLNAFGGQSTTGVFYGGTFTPTSAVQASGTATYRRTGGALVSTVRGVSNSATTNQDYDARVRGDVELTANFDTGQVNGRISGAGRTGGADFVDGNSAVVLSGASISGGDFNGGTASLVNNTGAAIYESGAQSNFFGSFMGANQQAAAGTALITGRIQGEQAATTAVFIGDKQP
ncbi:hypothetical protein [Sagittula salina]|uniref:Transferrin-binding protein B C-lobe/N-lobe beta barrel domain-containing protein n=1 Tax=Sagittula salina TaxID=2820268 RepID=A0A940MQ91_9RHOB|nr:hypothetical protein [Sagittula salina]MBP0482738.1 hypothetical protein [Sagittula salina]